MSFRERSDASFSPREPSFFSCAVQRSSRGAVWIRLSGELDLATAGRLTQTLDEALVSTRLIVVDLRQLTFIDSTGLRSLVRAHERARAGERRLVLIRGLRQVDRLLRITGLSDGLQITDLTPIQPPPAPGSTPHAA